MSDILLSCGAVDGTSVAAGVNRTFCLVGRLLGIVGDVAAQIKVNEAYTLKNLYCRILTNGGTTNGTFADRVGGANGSQSVSITALTTGEFEDTSNTTAVSSGGLINTRITSGATGATIFSVSSLIARHASNVGISGSNSGAAWASATSYHAFFGDSNDFTTETNRQVTMRTAVTLRNLRSYVATNTRDGDGTFRTRVDVGNGNQVVTITAGVTGEFEDTSNSDAISVGSEVNFQFILGGTTGSFGSGAPCQVEIEGAVRSGWGSNVGMGLTTLVYVSVNDGGTPGTTESAAQIKARCTTPFKNLYTYASANLAVVDTPIALRANASSVISVSVTALTTGVFEETSTTYTPATTDELNFMIDASNAVSAITMQVVSIEQLPAAAAAFVGFKTLLGVGQI